jgi:hypothetical protein
MRAKTSLQRKVQITGAGEKAEESFPEFRFRGRQ